MKASCMDNLVNRSALDNALQRISQLERMAVNSTSGSATVASINTSSAGSVNNVPSQSQNNHTRPNLDCYPPTQTVTTANNNIAEELYNRFPSLRRPTNNMPLPSGPRLGLPSQSGLGPKGKKSKKKHTSRSTKPTKPVLRDLVLIPNPEETTVPTHSTRVLLDSKGFVVHSFPFQREWDSRTLTSKIDEAFPMYTLLCFEYMKVSTGNYQ